MSRAYAVRKCPNCCPDGGAIMDYTSDRERRPTWKCRNCLHEFPRIVRARNVVETSKQGRMVEALERKGYRVTRRQMIGVNLFVALVKGEGLASENLMGTIGPRGRIELERYSLGCSGVKFTHIREVW